MPVVPSSLHYSAEHEWVDATEGTVKVGVTDVATDQLGEIVYVDLPEVGDTLTAGETCGEIESTKSVSDLYSPVSGTVVSINDDAVDNPATINDEPYGAGWLFTVEVTEVGPLLTAEDYAAANEATVE